MDELTPYVPRLLLEAPGDRYFQRNGSLVFIDLSGFTAMSEKLASLGRVGSEEVTDILNSTFSRLLEVAYSQGGSLLKFGGDALILFFDGSAHAERAVGAAAGMRSTLRRIGKITTSVGNFSLRMSTGVQSGDFSFFLCGSSHQELIVTGPEVTETVELEKVALGGEIVMGRNTGAFLPRSLLGEEKGGGVLLNRAPKPRRGVSDDQSVAPSTGAAEFVPLAIRAHIREGAEDPEHRLASVAFLRYRGTDRMLQEQGAGYVHARLDSFVSSVQSIVEEQGICFLGSDIDADGGKIILVSGAPIAFGNDEERLLRAVRAILDEEYGFDVAAGVNTGHVYAGVVGPPFRRTYTVMGDVVNSAARLMASAGVAEILAAKRTLTASATEFMTSDLPPMKVKGKTRALLAASVGAIKGRRKDPGAVTPIVGRERDLARLESAVQGALEQNGKIVILTGEPGIGKTRILQEMRQRHGTVDAISIWCDPFRKETPYFTFRLIFRRLAAVPPEDKELGGEALRKAVGAAAPDLLAWLPLLALVADVDVDPTPESSDLDKDFVRPKLAKVTAAALQALHPDPALVLIDDIQWLDEGSAYLLAQLARDLSRPWLLCMTARPGEFPVQPEELGAESMQLGPLDHEAAMALARAESGRDMLPQVASMLAERAGGNPMFLKELVTAHDLDVDADSLPNSVEALVTSRIDRLGSREKRILRLAAILGSTFSRDDLDMLLFQETGRPLESLGPLQEFLEEVEGLVRFRQILAQESAHQVLPYRTRRRLHLRVAQHMESSRDVSETKDVLSFHFHRGGEYQKSWEYSRMAAEAAVEKYAYSLAVALFERSLEAAKFVKPSSDDVAHIWEAYGDACQALGRFDLSAKAYRSARLLSTDPVSIAHLHQREGVIRERLGSYSLALRSYSKGLSTLSTTILDARGITQEALLTLSIAALKRRRGQFRAALRLAQQAQRELEAIDDQSRLAHAYSMMHMIKRAMGEHSQALGRAALELFEKSGQLRFQANALNNLAVDMSDTGDWSAARELYKRSLQLQTQIGNDVGAATVSMNIAELLVDQGMYDEAEPLLEESMKTLRAARLTAFTIDNLLYKARLSMGRGHTEEAEDLLHQVLEGYKRLGATGSTARARLAECLLLARRPQEALAITRELLPAATGLLRPLIERVHGYALMQTGSFDEAKSHLVSSLDAARSQKARYEEGLTLRAFARWARASGADPSSYEYLASGIMESLGVVSVPEIPAVV